MINNLLNSDQELVSRIRMNLKRLNNNEVETEDLTALLQELVDKIGQNEFLFNSDNYSLFEAVITIDINLKVFDLNKQAEILLGVCKNDVRQKDVTSFIRINDKEIQEELPSFIQQYNSFDEFSSKTTEALLTDNNNNTTKILLKVFPIRNNVDNIGSALIFQPISTKEQLYIQLIESQERYQNFIEKSKEGIYYIEYTEPIYINSPIEHQAKQIVRCGFVQTCNNALAKMYGFEYSHELVGKTLAEFYGTDPDNINMDANKKFIESGYQIEEVETTEFDSEGNIKYFLNTLSGVINEGKLIGNWGVQRDITALKQYEKALIESEEKYRLIAENTADTITISNFDLTVKYISPSIIKLRGYTPEEVYDQTADQILTPDSIERASVILQKEMELEFSGQGDPRRSVAIELQQYHKNGSLIWIENRSSFFRDSTGKPVGIISISTDITERKNYEAQLLAAKQKAEASEAYLSALFRQSPVSIQIFDKNGMTIDVNPSWEVLWNTTSDVVINNYNIFEDDYARKIGWIEFVEPAFRGETSYISEKTYDPVLSGHPGRSRTLRCIAFPIKINGVVERVVMMHEDITDQKRVESALEESENRFKQMVDASSDAIVLLKDGKFIECNDATLKILDDIPREKLLGSEPTDISPEYQSDGKLSTESAVEKIQKAYSEGHNKFDWDIITFSNNLKIIEVILIPILINGEMLLHSTWRDVSEDRKIRQELIDAKEKSEISDKLKSEFLAQVSHEIRTPINAILSFSNLIKDELEEKMGNDLRDSFASIQRAGKRITRTIDLILNMSEIQSGSYDYIAKPLDVYNDIIMPIYSEYKHIAKDQELALIIKKETNNTHLIADVYTVEQIIQNLLDNAIKYTLEGGVELLIDRDENNKLFIAIRDTGIGISEEYLPNLFIPFSQEEQGYTRKFEGNGLGLALVKKYCELNNASIEVDSIKNVGTTFTITFNG